MVCSKFTDQDGVTGEDGQEWNQKPKSKAHEHNGFVVILIVAIAHVYDLIFIISLNLADGMLSKEDTIQANTTTIEAFFTVH